jgi:hypothetical protein
MSRNLRRIAVIVLVAGALGGCDIRQMGVRQLTVQSERATHETPCVRRVLTRPTGNC